MILTTVVFHKSSGGTNGNLEVDKVGVENLTLVTVTVLDLTNNSSNKKDKHKLEHKVKDGIPNIFQSCDPLQ